MEWLPYPKSYKKDIFGSGSKEFLSNNKESCDEILTGFLLVFKHLNSVVRECLSANFATYKGYEGRNCLTSLRLNFPKWK